jgi:crotonobetainyl-CoA:carnitine CoA-transferase CaiB-like acyl-CoA transferase
MQGYRILDFTHVLSGPITTNFLRQQGAQVVKVESAAGDTMRNYGSGVETSGMGSSFVSVNSGKRSIVLDLKNPAHVEAVKRLVSKSDVVVENFRPGVIDRLGLGYDVCRAIKPDVVFCSVSGFGQSGSLKANPAIDQIVQSMSGLMQLSGEPGSGPMRIGFPAVDTYTGLLAAFAIVAALLNRERTGEGQYIDVAMFDAAMVMMISLAGPYLVSGTKPEKQGNRGYSLSPVADTFPTKQGYITLGVVRDEQYQLLCRLIERPDLAADARFAERKLRFRNAAVLQAEVVKTLLTRTAEEWEKILNDGGVAAGAVRELPEAIALAHFDARKLKLPIRVPGLAREEVQILGSGFVYGHDQPAIDAPPPRLGEHTREVLAELGYSQAEIDAIMTSAARPRQRNETKEQARQ